MKNLANDWLQYKATNAKWLLIKYQNCITLFVMFISFILFVLPPKMNEKCKL